MQKNLLKTLLLGAVALLAQSAFAQQDLSKVEIKTQKLSDTVDMLATVTQRIKEQIGAGRNVEAIVAAKPTSEYEKSGARAFCLRINSWR